MDLNTPIGKAILNSVPYAIQRLKGKPEGVAQDPIEQGIHLKEV